MTEIVKLEPLRQSFDANEQDLAVKQAFLQLTEELIRKDERKINVYGAPYLGDNELKARFSKQNGFAIINKSDESMHYLFKAWRYRNRLRGLHLLRTYLQLLFPNNWVANQMWQDKNIAYPNGLETESKKTDNHFLTNRVHISIDAELTAQQILKYAPSIRTTLAAKYLIKMFLLRHFENTYRSVGLGISNGTLSRGYIRISGICELAKTHIDSTIDIGAGFTNRGYIRLTGKGL